MEKADLVDAIFEAFRETAVWKLIDLRMKLEQPEKHLQKVLREVAVYRRGGPLRGRWTRKGDFRDAATKAECGSESEEVDDWV